MASINFKGRLTDLGGGNFGIATENQAGLIFYVDYKTKGAETGIIIKFKIKDSNLNKLAPLDPINLEFFYLCKIGVGGVIDKLEQKIQEAGKKVIPCPMPITTTAIVIEAVWDGVADPASEVDIWCNNDSLRYV